MADPPKKEVVALGRALIEVISKSAVLLSSRLLALLTEPPQDSSTNDLKLRYPEGAYLLCTQLHVAHQATSALCEDLIKQTPPDSDNVIMEPATFATLLDLSTTTKNWEDELRKVYGLSLTLQ